MTDDDRLPRHVFVTGGVVVALVALLVVVVWQTAGESATWLSGALIVVGVLVLTALTGDRSRPLDPFDPRFD